MKYLLILLFIISSQSHGGENKEEIPNENMSIHDLKRAIIKRNQELKKKAELKRRRLNKLKVGEKPIEKSLSAEKTGL